MKKQVLSIAFALVAVVANAQDMNSKRGTPILPEAGDWSIGFNAVPFLDWAFDKTRIMSSSAATTAEFAMDYQLDQTIVLQKMKTENKAMRLKFRFETMSNKEFKNVDKSGSTTDEEVEDSKVYKNRNIQVSYASLTYRGKGRLKGFYGVEGMIGLNDGGRTTYNYSNEINADYTNPASGDFGDNLSGGSRDLKVKDRGNYSLGVSGVIGVEYFFAPKMSVACEYTWGAMYSRTGKGKETSEAWDPDSNSVKETETEGARGERDADILIGNDNAAINLKFYF